MAQNFISSIAKSFSGDVPIDMATTGSFNAYAISSGPAQGSGERVYQCEMNKASNPFAYGSLVLASALTEGDLVIKYSDVTTTSSSNNAHSSCRIAVGVPAVGLPGADLEVGRTNDATQARKGKLNNGTQVDLFPTAFTAGKPRFLRINWTSTTFKARGWNADEAEGSTWPINVTTGLTIGSGEVRLFFAQDGQVVNFHWAAYSDVATTPGYKTTVAANDSTTLPGGNKTITFTATKSDGSPVPNSSCYLYDQATGLKLDEQLSDGNGLVSFTDVVSENVAYAVTLDPANTLDLINNFLNKGA